MESLTRFEKTRLLSARALQLSFGAPSLVKIQEGASAFDIASTEFIEKILPLSVLRRYPNGEEKRVSL